MLPLKATLTCLGSNRDATSRPSDSILTFVNSRESGSSEILRTQSLLRQIRVSMEPNKEPLDTQSTPPIVIRQSWETVAQPIVVTEQSGETSSTENSRDKEIETEPIPMADDGSGVNGLARKTQPRIVALPTHNDQALFGNTLKEQVRDRTLSSSLSLTDRRRLLTLNGFTFNWIENHLEFLDMVAGCQRAIDRNLHPQRISQGSSGSYFIKDESGGIVGVFKPKDEEPYGQLNPKWIKWLHRTCCPCMFGRSFLMPNIGYISEAAASHLDAFLGLNMVPRTQVVHLSSSAFYFPWWEHYKVWKSRRKDPNHAYPLKLGSFQLYVEGFEDSTVVLAKLDSLRPLEPELRKAYQLEFEKMTVLDYAMRNTDRSMNNWLIHLSWIEDVGSDDTVVARHANVRSAAQSSLNLPPSGGEKVESYLARNGSDAELDMLKKRLPHLRPRVKIACIDNGLAFPFKHPHEVRSYPYSWANLPEARIPYSEELRTQLLPILSDTSRWEVLVDELRQIFKIDSDFNQSIFRRQMAILRGQLYNIVQSLRAKDSPIQLIHRPLLLIEEDEMDEKQLEGGRPDGAVSDRNNNPTAQNTAAKGRRAHRHRHTPVNPNPLCTCW